MVHVLATHRAEAGNHKTDRTGDFRGAASSPGPGHGFGQFSVRAVIAFQDDADGGAFPRRIVDRASGMANQAAQDAITGTIRIMNGATSGAASASGHPVFVAKVAIGAQAGTFEPRCVVELSGLHMKADRDKSGVALCVLGRSAAVSATEIAHHRFALNKDNPAVAIAVMVTISVSVSVSVSIPVPVPVLILIAVLRRSERRECKHRHQDQAEEKRNPSHNTPLLDLCR